MEYCPDGTLEALMKPEVVLTEETIFDVLLQIMEGYRPLWSNKILHQDLKPDNILRKGNTLKITDFGFSILYEGYHFTSLREGTLLYMPLEKLSKLNYEPSTKSDVYSIGVIMFKLITKRHPYFNGPRVPQ